MLMKNIKINTIDFNQLLPHWMREDTIDASLAESVSSYVHDMAGSMQVLSKWSDEAIESMSEKYLDLLAHELDVTWYLFDAPIDQKREIIRKAKRIHWKIGTKWAIEQVLSIYFTSASVLEWFDYSGTPGHFKILTAYPELYVNDANFIKVLNSIKRFSQILDEVSLTNEIQGTAYAAAALVGTVRNTITDTFTRTQVVSHTAYGSIGQGGGFARVTIS
jgi:P2-related tail formation protein